MEIQEISNMLAWKFHGQRSKAGYTVHGVTEESDTAEQLSTHIQFSIHS